MLVPADVLHPIISSLYQAPLECNRLQYLFSAFEEGVKLCQAVLHSDVAPFFLNYRANLKEVLRISLIGT